MELIEILIFFGINKKNRKQSVRKQIIKLERTNGLMIIIQEIL